MLPQGFLPSRDQADFLSEMRARGATTPAQACDERALPRLSRAQFQVLVDLGIVREGAPGTFYLYGDAHMGPRAARRPPLQRLAIVIFFWLLIILVPVLLLRSRH
ncbi:MAG TPA: hypothetical protein VG916_14655 [Gemmatimonadaceae bacterium]|nr:hypothetical protein [Gemmatimonadaceae bacterium]